MLQNSLRLWQWKGLAARAGLHETAVTSGAGPAPIYEAIFFQCFHTEHGRLEVIYNRVVSYLHRFGRK